MELVETENQDKEKKITGNDKYHLDLVFKKIYQLVFCKKYFIL